MLDKLMKALFWIWVWSFMLCTHLQLGLILLEMKAWSTSPQCEWQQKIIEKQEGKTNDRN